jgi:heterodisulfide reductase subunit C
MECPEGIDVTGVIRMLRYIEASEGNYPKRFRMASASVADTGYAFPINENVNKKRAALGLDPLSENEDAVNDLKKIIARTGYRG